MKNVAVLKCGTSKASDYCSPRTHYLSNKKHRISWNIVIWLSIQSRSESPDSTACDNRFHFNSVNAICESIERTRPMETFGNFYARWNNDRKYEGGKDRWPENDFAHYGCRETYYPFFPMSTLQSINLESRSVSSVATNSNENNQDEKEEWLLSLNENIAYL